MSENIAIEDVKKFIRLAGDVRESLTVSEKVGVQIADLAIAQHEETERLRAWQTKAVEDLRELHEELDDANERLAQLHDKFAKYRGEHRPFIDEDLLRGKKAKP